MSIASDLKDLYPQVKAARMNMEERGRDQDILYTMLFKIIQELQAIKQKLGP